MAEIDRFGASVAAGVRRGGIAGALFWVLVAGFVLFLVASAFAPALGGRLRILTGGTDRYRLAQWASTAALAAWVALATAFAAWLLGRTFRGALGLPRRAHRSGFFALRVVLAVPLSIWLLIWASDEYVVRGVSWAPTGALVIGLAMCLMFAHDVPRLLKNGASALRSRVALLRVPRMELTRLHDGWARLRGVVAAGGETFEGHDGRPCVYCRDRQYLGDKTEESFAPFLLERGGASLSVEAAAGQAVVEAVAVHEQPAALDAEDEADVVWVRDAELPVGAEVEVVGQVSVEGGAYRGSARIHAGDGVLLVMTRAAAAHRRLLLSALVELGSALVLAGCVVGLVVFWVVVRQLTWR